MDTWIRLEVFLWNTLQLQQEWIQADSATGWIRQPAAELDNLFSISLWFYYVRIYSVCISVQVYFPTEITVQLIHKDVFSLSGHKMYTELSFSCSLT